MDEAGRTFSLEDLATWREAQPGGTWLAVLGDPIGHSLSPAMHNAALADMARRAPELASWRYVRFQVPAEALPEALPRFHQAGFRGLNLTLPHKVQAVPLVRAVAPEAAAVGAVNTLKWEPEGYAGSNTDGYGVARAVEQAFGGGLAERELVLIGAGGAARSVARQALADGCPRVWIGNRSAPRLDELVALLRGSGVESARVVPFLLREPPPDLPSAPLLINASAAGLGAGDALPLDLSRFAPEALFYDTTYGVRNAWAEACAARGIAYADGLLMLVWQGARSLEHWTGQPVPAEVMEAAARRALAAR